jgi:hypothetical protein
VRWRSVREAVAGDALVSELIDAMLNARTAGIEPQNLNKPAPPPHVRSGFQSKGDDVKP